MPREIERKYRVENDAWRRDAESRHRIRQGYLSLAPGRTVRVRVVDGERATLSIKGRSEGPARVEYEYPIPLQDGSEMLGMCIPPLIEKTRHVLRRGGYRWEIDEFHGANDGLVVAEVELGDAGQPPAELPVWIGEEVTGDPRFYNARLVSHPYREWRGG